MSLEKTVNIKILTALPPIVVIYTTKEEFYTELLKKIQDLQVPLGKICWSDSQGNESVINSADDLITAFNKIAQIELFMDLPGGSDSKADSEFEVIERDEEIALAESTKTPSPAQSPSQAIPEIPERPLIAEKSTNRAAHRRSSNYSKSQRRSSSKHCACNQYWPWSDAINPYSWSSNDSSDDRGHYLQHRCRSQCCCRCYCYGNYDY
ncbi:unnamed protein product [Cylicostephanus goldi]|uniref:Uncharacterized protein n=1 Tax=Cylicostephanus goldi TaxID=71465 RepID=A0A3P6S7I3_CYLGO|nr:unnamed protein product [Cylicostephanus goldi]